MSPLAARPQAEVLERIAPLLVRPLADITREHVERAMILCGGNRSLAAQRLGLSRTTLQSMLARYRKADA